MDDARLSCRAVTRETLADLQRFSERHGKFRYCSCMRWRLPSGEFTRAGKTGRVAALDRLVGDGVPVGVLAHRGAEPVGWCSIAPRETYGALERSRAIARVGADAPVWSVVCFFLDPAVQGAGVPALLLRAAVEYAVGQGAGIIEAYPWPGGPSYRYMGTRELYEELGFVDVVVPAGSRAVMRLRAGPR